MGEDPQYFFTDQGKTDRLKKINQQKLFLQKIGICQCIPTFVDIKINSLFYARGCERMKTDYVKNKLLSKFIYFY